MIKKVKITKSILEQLPLTPDLFLDDFCIEKRAFNSYEYVGFIKYEGNERLLFKSKIDGTYLLFSNISIAPPHHWAERLYTTLSEDKIKEILLFLCLKTQREHQIFI